MKKNIIFLLNTSIILALAACDNKPTQNTNANTVVESTDNTATETVLITPDNSIQITTTPANFSDYSNNSAFLPANTKPENILLVQYDEDQNLNISASKLGKTESDIKTLADNLNKTLEQNKQLQQSKVETINDQQIQYSYTNTEETPINESCTLTIAQNKTLINACASSTKLSLDELKTVIKEVKINL